MHLVGVVVGIDVLPDLGRASLMKSWDGSMNGTALNVMVLKSRTTAW